MTEFTVGDIVDVTALGEVNARGEVIEMAPGYFKYCLSIRITDHPDVSRIGEVVFIPDFFVARVSCLKLLAEQCE